MLHASTSKTGIINAKIEISQVRDGFEYTGSINFDERWKFQYELRCDHELGELDKQAVTDLEGAIRQMHLTVKTHDGHPIALPEIIIPLFQGLILPFASDFYHNPQTRGSNSGVLGQCVRGGGPIGTFCTMQLSMSATRPFARDKLEPILREYFPNP